MMRPLPSIALALLLVLAAAAQQKPAAHATPQAAETAQAQPGTVSGPGHIVAPPKSYRFPDNQTLVYTGEWRLWTAGTATLRMEPAGAQRKVIATADSTGFVSLLYHVHDIFESYFDPATFCSAHIYKHTEEGFRRLDTNIAFEYGRHVAVLEEKNLRKGTAKREEHEVPGCATDVVSGIFYVGSLPLLMRAHYSFPLNDGNNTIYADAAVEGGEDLATPAGTFHTIRVQISVSSGPLKDRGKIWIWYDAATRVPVQMRGRLFWGTLTFTLNRIDRK